LNKNILHADVQSFITNNLNTDVVSVLLKKITFKGVTTKELVEQLEAKKKCKEKLPTWFNLSAIYFPNKLNIEQTSSEVTAAYKAKIVTGDTLIDITGGFGIDSYFFSEQIQHVTHCEINENLSKTASYNFEILKANNIKTYAESGLEVLKNRTIFFDWIYIDPSRRNDVKGKVFLLADCLPNVPEHLPFLFKKTNQILIKTSPLLDFSIGINELQFVKQIHVVAVKNEAKELLWILEKNYKGSVTIKTINYTTTNEVSFSFSLTDEKQSISKYSLPLVYLYEPNVAILKSGAFKTVGNAFGVNKLHEHTHLYTSPNLKDFPGRQFKILKTLPYHKKTIQKIGLKKANITTRNFPDTVATIRKNFKIKDGGSTYLFFTKNIEDLYVVLVCEKLNSN